MEVLLIAGPASSPLDQARTITNTSTGKTGIAVAEELRRQQFHLTLWYGHGATHPLPKGLQASIRFTTVQDLENLLQKEELSRFAAILLPAALPDYELKQATTATGQRLAPGKWPGSLGGVHLELRPGKRILPRLRQLAPLSQIIGWKWEAEGSHEELLASARQQMAECQTQACVLNGPAYGSGYLLVPQKGEPIPCPNSTHLGQSLAVFLAQTHD